MVIARNISIIKNQGSDTAALCDELVAWGHTVTAVTDNVHELALGTTPLALDLGIVQVPEAGLPNLGEIADAFKGQGVPFICLAAAYSAPLNEQLAQAGPACILTYPFHLSNLRNAVALAPWPDTGTDGLYPGGSLFVKNNNLLVQVKTDDILYVHAEGNYCNLVTRSRRLLLKMSMTQVKPLLPTKDFVQVHRNYIVRLTEVDSISLTDSELSINGAIIPVSKTKFRDALLTRVKMVK